MAKSSIPILFSCAILILFCHSHAQDANQKCSGYRFEEKTFKTCIDLPALDSSIHWTYDDSSKMIDMGFRMVVETEDRWVAWGINPTSKGMVGCQAFIGLRESEGPVKAYTTPITSYGTKLLPGNLSFTTYEVSAMAKDEEMIIFAKFELPGDATNVNHVWQEGPVANNQPRMHPLSGPNVQSLGTINMVSGKSTTTSSAGDSTMLLRMIHMILNTISWGVMMPIGVIFARHVKVFPNADPAWFYLHQGCQTTSYIMGISGIVIGIVLGNQSPGVEYGIHRKIGITLFVTCTLQVLAIWLRPDKKHKYRFYWNIYHRSVGYTTVILGITNIFLGFAIAGAKQWQFAYTIFIAILAFVFFVLEIVTWFYVWKTKSNHGETDKI